MDTVICKLKHSRWFWRLLPLLLFVGVALCIFRGWGDYYFGHRSTDMFFQFYPWRVFMSRWVSAGVIPFWDPHVFGGCPVLEMQQRGIWYPISFLSIILFPPRLSLLFEMTAHIGVGILVSWFGLRKGLHLSLPASAICVCCFMFGSAMVGRVIASHFTVVATSGWMLLVIASTCQALNADLRVAWRWLAIGAFACAAMVYAGSPQYVVYVGWSQIAFLLGAFGVRQWRRTTLIFFGMWCCAALLSAPQWLPTLAYLPWSARASGDLMKNVPIVDYVTSIIEFLTPMPFGDEVRTSHLLQKSFWETASYPGMLGVVLALCAFLSVIRKRPRSSHLGRVTLGAACIVLLGFYLCGNGKLPGMGSFREPLKARTVIVLGLSLLSAVGVEVLYMSFLSRRNLCRRVVILFVSTACALLLFYGLFFALLHSSYGVVFVNWLLGEQEPYDTMSIAAWHAAKQNPQLLLDMMYPAIYRAAGFVLCGIVLLSLTHYYLRYSRRYAMRVCMGVMFVLAAVEPYVIHLPLYRSQCSFDAAEIPQEMRDSFVSKIAEARKNGEPLWRVAINRQLPNMSHHLDGFYETSGYDPIRPDGANTRQVLIGGFRQWEQDKQQALHMISLAIGQRYDCVDWSPQSGVAFESALKENNSSARLVSIERNIVAGRLSDDNYGPTSAGLHFIVPPSMARCKAGDVVDSASQKIVERISMEQRSLTMDTLRTINDGMTPNQYELKVTLGSPAVLLYHTTWLPGWRVRVDNGKEMQPWLANSWMLGVPLNAGEHHVCFIYRPQHYALSWMLGTIGIVLLFAIGNGAIKFPIRRSITAVEKKSRIEQRL